MPHTERFIPEDEEAGHDVPEGVTGREADGEADDTKSGQSPVMDNSLQRRTLSRMTSADASRQTGLERHSSSPTTDRLPFRVRWRCGWFRDESSGR